MEMTDCFEVKTNERQSQGNSLSIGVGWTKIEQLFLIFTVSMETPLKRNMVVPSRNMQPHFTSFV